jgi:hypothetical protein
MNYVIISQTLRFVRINKDSIIESAKGEKVYLLYLNFTLKIRNSELFESANNMCGHF